MSIEYDDVHRVFSLHTENSTYQMKVDDHNVLLHLYYGRRSAGCMDYLLTYADRGFSGNPYDAGRDRTYSLDALPQEFPCRGSGDYRNSSCIVRSANGARSSDLRYAGYEILPGKYALEGLPAVYAKDEEAQTLKIYLSDEVSRIRITLLYGVLYDEDVITRSVIVENKGCENVYIERLLSACLDFVSGDFDLYTFYGRHCFERQPQREPIGHGTCRVGSRRGTSSHQYNPFLIVAAPDTSENLGDCWSMSFVYSGGFIAEAEKDQYDQTRILMGLQDEDLGYLLMAGESFTAPEVILTFSSMGLNRLSQNLHRTIREHICRGKYAAGSRPILLNSWESFHFDFDGEKIYQLALDAKDLGMDMVVLDDGWFCGRNDDYGGLGDWQVNEGKLGEPLGELIQRINAAGIKFGIWFEPECVSEDSSLYREHPDWVLEVPTRKPVRSRNQLMLDFSRPEVVDEVFKKVCAVLDQGNIEYLKWDMNRSLGEPFSQGGSHQGGVAYRYVLGLYGFLERLHERYPDMLIEGCSGGGGRFDAGMLYYVSQIWCSDNTDAVDQTYIQHGTSFGYPMSAVSSHVSAVPNEQNGRYTPLNTRGIVAMSGGFGYELDPSKLTDDEKALIREQIASYRKYGSLICRGLFYRLGDPEKDTVAAWEYVSEDGSEVLISAIVLKIHGNMPVSYVIPQGLKEGSFYRDDETGKVYPADSLMQTGFPLPIDIGEYRAYQFYLREV